MWRLLLPVLGLLVQGPESTLPVEPRAGSLEVDWLLDRKPFEAWIHRSVDGALLVLNNGLVRRETRVQSGCATVVLRLGGRDQSDDFFESQVFLVSLRIPPGGTQTMTLGQNP